ncbi:MAG TPA: tetratricopeptide repeat protein [Cryomorphaceae bacterium]|nr:tetratricopeptide repeat protein [Cryomorphaceae bacterium]HCY25922.1 tetratricopeptide repeat protein [Cryomorphaceae bacterium]|tara:strand:- start:1328 stop:2011 length:684 start_codon:yes stop_codon:yes gene_type:complete
MAKKKASDQQDNLGFENVEQTLTKTEQFLEKNAKQVGIAIGAVVLLVLAVFAYTTYIVAPNSAEAGKEMSKAIKWFETDSMALALNGNSDHAGFLDIMDEYSGTPAGNSAHYYAGLAYFSQGSFQDAIEVLDGYSASDVATAAMAKGVIGDAFAELGQMDDAADYYKKAANATDNNFTTPLFLWKAGLALEAQGDANKAVPLYQRIADDYPKSRQAAGIESVIAALK